MRVKRNSGTHHEFRSDVWNMTEIHSTLVYSNKFVYHCLVSPLWE